ncbi:Cytochrome P450 86A2 [Hibiscus syriacus]|uniref:Cytochrome P450 86A2 n=1 Tax=Hibiscus syriacus TaxID=106335 RepID=A0A6A2ZGK3_HIBSY|nr:Cytochrome P450 86A2 [Hibiscus syriacus]
MVTVGLSKQPMDTIAKQIVSMGFNCVRYTWPVYLVTNDSLASLTVRQSFRRLGFLESIAEIQANNPSIIDVSLIEAFQAVISSLGKNNLMVILDNHISKPGWCCNNLDDHGFFGDKYFNRDQWTTGLTRMATLFNGVIKVVGMSLRNELRGSRQNVNDWYKYMQKGSEAVHSANPNAFVILSGFDFDRDLSFIKTQPFGIDQTGTSVNGNRYLNCFMGVAAELDLDWAMWTPTGSYYVREGVVGLNEHYGALDYNWSRFVRSQTAQSYLPSLNGALCHKEITRPPVAVRSLRRLLRLELFPHKTLLARRTHLCLQAGESRTSAKLNIFCTASDNTIITRSCKCINNDNTCDPSSQWFKLVDSTRNEN